VYLPGINYSTFYGTLPFPRNEGALKKKYYSSFFSIKRNTYCYSFKMARLKATCLFMKHTLFPETKVSLPINSR
jgi:hypothetical protein